MDMHMTNLMLAWHDACDAGDTISDVFFLECLLWFNDERSLSGIPSVWA